MAQFKLVDGARLNEALTAVAQAIREKSGGTEPLEFPSGFVSGISALGSGTEEADLFWLYSTNQLEEYSCDEDGTMIDYAWRFCTNLRRVTYRNLKVTGSSMFSNCYGLEEAYFPEAITLSGSTFYRCTSLHTVFCPKATQIRNNAFEYCTALERCDLPSAARIQDSAFRNCEKLATLILRSSSVVALNAATAFGGTPIESGTGYVYVPGALLEAYQQAANWSAFAGQFRAIEDYPEICGGGV